ncbi:MAG: DUF5318 family protein [Corynebacterium sp.]|nr:DUF5318 family protein [Corynebacterium sp.]
MSLVRTGQLDHRWQRAKVLQDYHAGLLRREDICDADFLLKTAARFHGYKRTETAKSSRCPICEKEDIAIVLWVHGEELGRASGSARSWQEIEEFAREGKVFDVHRVEVCPDCGWNFLLTQQTVRWENEP